MSSHLVSSKGSRLFLATMVAIATIMTVAALVTAEHPEDQDANQGGTGLSTFTGEWMVGIGDDLVYANQTIKLDGNLTISDGGKLVLMNVTLVLHGGAFDPQEISVFDGSLTITDLDGDHMTEHDRSIIQADDPEANYYFAAFEEATLTLANSYVRDCGRNYNEWGFTAAVYVATEDAEVYGTEFALGFGGLFIDGVNIEVENCLVQDNEWIGVYVDHDAAPTLVGCEILDNFREGLKVVDQSDVTIRECSIRGNLRGAVIDGAYLTAHESAISGNSEVDLDLPYFSQVELFNCTISTSGGLPPIRMENSSLTSTHGNFDIDKVDMFASTFFYQQYLTVEVSWADSLSTPIPDAAVMIEDAEGTFYPSMTTDSNGLVEYLPVQVMEYKHNGVILQTFMYNPFHVTVTHNLLDKDTYADMRYDNAKVVFQYLDVIPPTAQAPQLSEADVGVATQLDGSACFDNVAVAIWNWSFDEFGMPIYLEGEKVDHVFLEAKTYSITLKVYDSSDNSDTGSMVKFNVVARDRIPPTPDAGPSQEVEQGTVITFDGSNSSDNVGIVEYTWSFTYDGAPRSLTGRTVTWKFDTPGFYLVVLTVEDAAGLTGSNETSVTVQDTTSPVTTVVFNPEMPIGRKYNQIVQIIFNVEDVGGGQVELNYRINGVIWEKVTGGLSLSFGGDLQYGDGNYEIEYYAQDTVGNLEELQTIAEFVVDGTAPAFTNLEPPVSPYTVTSETYTITGKTEAGAILTINEDQVPLAADGTFSYEAVLVKGDNAFYLHTVDSVGHTADLTIVLTLTDYDPGNGNGDGGSNLLLYGALGGAVLVVIVLLLFFFVMQKNREDEEM